MPLHKPFPFQQCKNAVLQSMVYNVHRSRNVHFFWETTLAFGTANTNVLLQM